MKMNIEAIEKINFRKVYKLPIDELRILQKQDELCIGTKHYQGLAWFHNYEYRHLLRSKGDYEEWKNVERPKKSWNKLYKQIHDAFLKAGLETDGFSKEHTKIIERILNFKKGYLIKAYHEKN